MTKIQYFTIRVGLILNKLFFIRIEEFYIFAAWLEYTFTSLFAKANALIATSILSLRSRHGMIS